MNKRSIDFRRDFRTEEEFKADIKKRTKKEKFLVGIFQKEMENKGHNCVVLDHAENNDGEFLATSNCKADYVIEINGNAKLYDIKCSPVRHKWTMKVYQLQKYLENKVNIIIFYGTGYIDKKPEDIDYEHTRYGIIPYKKIKDLLKNYKHYKDSKFGNKSCIQVRKKDFELFIKPKKLLLTDKDK